MRLSEERRKLLTAATVLALTLNLLGCATYTSRPSVNPTSKGNAWAVILPVGTTLKFPSQEAQDQFQAVAVNEAVKIAPGGSLKLQAPVYAISRPYLNTRDAVELELHRRIDSLETQLEAAKSRSQ